METQKNNVTKDEIRAARVRSLWDYLLRFHPDEFRAVGTDMLCSKAKDSVYIKRGFPGFNDFSSGNHGNSVDFLIKYLGYGFVDAVNALNGSHVPVCRTNPPPQGSTDVRRTSSMKICMPEAAPGPYRRVYAYLMHRGIPADIIQRLESSGLLYQDKPYGNAVFISQERDYCELRGTLTYSERPFHGCRRSAPDRFWYTVSPDGKPQTAFICEGAIDAISLLLIHRKAGITVPAAYFSIGGVSNQQAIERIKRIFPAPVLAVDNDPAGQKCRERNPDLGYIIPVLKDWNEDLLSGIERHEGTDLSGSIPMP